MAPFDFATPLIETLPFVTTTLFGAGVVWGVMRGQVRQLREDIAAQSRKITEIELEQGQLALQIAALPTRAEQAELARRINEGFSQINGALLSLAQRGSIPHI